MPTKTAEDYRREGVLRMAREAITLAQGRCLDDPSRSMCGCPNRQRNESGGGFRRSMYCDCDEAATFNPLLEATPDLRIGQAAWSLDMFLKGKTNSEYEH